MFDVLIVVKILTVVFWVVTLCSLGGACQCFGKTYRLHLQRKKIIDIILFQRFLR
jgi:hypothetical protein